MLPISSAGSAAATDPASSTTQGIRPGPKIRAVFFARTPPGVAAAWVTSDVLYDRRDVDLDLLVRTGQFRLAAGALPGHSPHALIWRTGVSAQRHRAACVYCRKACLFPQMKNQIHQLGLVGDGSEKHQAEAGKDDVGPQLPGLSVCMRVTSRGRWCTDRCTAGFPSLMVARYAVALLRWTDFGRAQSSIQLRTAQPIATSVRCAANERARSHRPMIGL